MAPTLVSSPRIHAHMIRVCGAGARGARARACVRDPQTLVWVYARRSHAREFASDPRACDPVVRRGGRGGVGVCVHGCACVRPQKLVWRLILVTHDHRARAGCIGDDGESSDEGGDGRHPARRSGGGERRRSGGDERRRCGAGDEATRRRRRGRRRGGRRASSRLLRRRRRPGRQQMRRRRRRPLPTCRNTCACGLIMLGAHARELASDPRVCDPISRRRGARRVRKRALMRGSEACLWGLVCGVLTL